MTIKATSTNVGTSAIAPTAMSFDRSGLGKSLRTITDRSRSAKKTSLMLWSNILIKMQVATWIICGIASFAFVVVASSPLMSFFFSFGMFFSGGWEEWREFTVIALQMSVTPALTAAVTAGASMALKFGQKTIQARIEEERKQDSEIRLIEELIKPSAS